ncbi:Eco57I restriction-modification methylase domain-containing protein [Cystobacter fuscus]
MNCLYGVDKNPLAVELAKLSLWLESHSEGLPLTFLNHRLICGDSITGARYENLLTRPGTGQPVSSLFLQRLVPLLEEVLNEALVHVHALEATIGKNVVDIEHKRTAKERLDRALKPFKLLARAWTGGAMLGPDGSDDHGYEELLKAVAERHDTEALVANRPTLARMVETGQGAFAYGLELPEVFFPDGTLQQSYGFDAVIGNPPWDEIQPLAKEFFAAFDLSILDAPTKLERTAIEERLLKNPEIKHAHDNYMRQFSQAKQTIGKCYSHVNRETGGRPSGASMDIWQVFAERGLQLLRHGGRVGFILPSAFHANQSATGIRELYLHQASLQCCYSFENRNKLFEIDSRFKFAAIVAQRNDDGTTEFPCAFYLHDLQWLFEDNAPLRYTLALIEKTGGEYLSFLELRSPDDAKIANSCFKNGEAISQVLPRSQIRLGREMHMTDDAWRFTSTSKIVKPDEDIWDQSFVHRLLHQGHLVLHEGKTFHQYNDHWDQPRYLVEVTKIKDRPAWLQVARHYRLAFRDIASVHG